MIPIKSKHTIKDTTTLTSSYVAGSLVSLDEHNVLGIMLVYTKGDETSVEMKFESSADGGSTYFQQSAGTITGGDTEELEPGIYKLTAANFASGANNITFKLNPIKADVVKVSVKSTGGTPTGTYKITAIAGWV